MSQILAHGPVVGSGIADARGQRKTDAFGDWVAETMSESTNPWPDLAGGPASGARTLARIWDLPTRLFHWLLVIAVFFAATTGFFAPANGLTWHVWFGYAIGALVVWRLIWGLFGSEYARLDRLFGALANVREHFAGLWRGKPKHYAGHNPAGSLMILGLILVLLGITATGLVVLGGAEKQGVLAGVTSYQFGHLAKGAHQLLAYLLMAMIAGHLAGVVIEMVLLRVPLIRGMITGWLPAGGEGEAARARDGTPLKALISTVFAAVAIAAAWLPLSALAGLGVPSPVTANATFVRECGSCHWPFHPSLLPRASWKAVMSSLDQHFGEDATLPEATASEIAAYLDTHAAETADTEPANRLREVSASEPRRITETRFWQRTHNDLRPELFKSAAVKSKANCLACHADAATGRFDDQLIDIPHKPSTGAMQ